MDSQSFLDDYKSLSKLLEKSQQANSERLERTKDPGEDVLEKKGENTRTSIQERIEKSCFEQQDGRVIPSCEVLYQQAVDTCDAFLGLSEKSPSSISCEKLLLKINLPALEDIGEVQVDCKDNRILLSSRDYKLFQYLPHKIKEDQSKAQWYPKKKLLTLSLPIEQQDLF